MFCPNCGTQNTEVAQTCAKCGFALKTAAAPKFKGTMLMMNQPGAAPGMPPRPAGPPPSGAPAPGGPPPQSGPGSGPGFLAEAPPIGAAGPPAGAAPPPDRSRLKGTIVGVAPPNFASAPGANAPASMGGGYGAQPSAPPPEPYHPGSPEHQQTFGSPGDANPLAGTMALDGPAAAHVFAPPQYGGGGESAPPQGNAGTVAFGAPPQPEGFGGYGAPPANAYGAPPPDAGGFGAPPPQAPHDPYAAPPHDPYAAQAGPPGGIYGAPTGGLDPYGAAPGNQSGFNPPPGQPLGGADPYGATPPPVGVGGGYGAPGPMLGGPPPQDYGAQLGAPQGYGQPPPYGQQQPPPYGQQQPYPGAGPLVGPGGLGALNTAPGAPKQWMITLLLWIFTGYFGGHRFYTGHILFGVIQFFTGGGCGVWWLIDGYLILTGKYTDSQGRPLQKT